MKYLIPFILTLSLLGCDSKLQTETIERDIIPVDTPISIDIPQSSHHKKANTNRGKCVCELYDGELISIQPANFECSKQNEILGKFVIFRLIHGQYKGCDFDFPTFTGKWEEDYSFGLDNNDDDMPKTVPNYQKYGSMFEATNPMINNDYIGKGTLYFDIRIDNEIENDLPLLKLTEEPEDYVVEMRCKK